MNVESGTIIAQLAKTLGVPLRKINMRDPNVFQREKADPMRSAESLAFREGLRFECDGLQAEIMSNGWYLILELKAAVNAGVWSINEPDQIALTRPVPNIHLRNAVFAVGAALPQKASYILGQTAFHSLLEELDLQVGESLHFYKNAVVYYSRVNSSAMFLSRTNDICRFVADIKQGQHVGSRHVDLPEPFSDLTETARHWAISDDSERSEALERASSPTLKKLVELVAPRLPSIDAYLSDHPEEQASYLGSLAETVAEAQTRLRQLH